MAPPYKRGFSFAGFQANQPRSPVPGPRLDIEFDEIAGVLSEFGEAIATLRPLPARSLNVNLLGATAYAQPVTIDAFKAVLGVQPPLEFTPENTAKRGQAGGYAPLDANARVPTANLPPVDLSGVQPKLGFVPEDSARRGQPSGYAPLGTDGKVPYANLPDLGSGGGGTPGPITSSSITDSTPSGRSVLTGTPQQGRDALQLGSAARLAVGTVAGSVMDGADSRVLAAVPISKATSVSAAPIPIWADHRVIFDRTFVGVGLATTPTTGAPGGGYADRMAWPGGGDFGSTSAVTGYVLVPPEAESSFEDGNPTNFFHCGVMGLTLNDTNNQATVGVFGHSRMGKTNARVFGGNLVASNWRNAGKAQSAGFHGQLVGLEIDCGWKQPSTPAGGSNMLGIWLPAECYGGQPDGDCAAIKFGRYSDFPWKHALYSDHGAAALFAQIGMKKGPLEKGPSESQRFFMISSRTGQRTADGDTNDYRFSYFYQSPDGDFVFHPNSGFGSLIVGNAALTQQSALHPTEGVSGPKGNFGQINVSGGGTISGTVTAGAVATGPLTASSGNFSSNVGVAGNITSGSSATGNHTVNGTIYLGSYPVLITPAGQPVPAGHRTLYLQP